MEAIVYLFFIGVGFLITVLAVRTAIDYSKTSQEVTEIRRLLEILVKNSGEINAEDKIGKNLKYIKTTDVPGDTCPNCGTKISQNDEICPSCGIKSGSD